MKVTNLWSVLTAPCSVFAPLSVQISQALTPGSTGVNDVISTLEYQNATAAVICTMWWCLFIKRGRDEEEEEEKGNGLMN